MMKETTHTLTNFVLIVSSEQMAIQNFMRILILYTNCRSIAQQDMLFTKWNKENKLDNSFIIQYDEVLYKIAHHYAQFNS